MWGRRNLKTSSGRAEEKEMVAETEEAEAGEEKEESLGGPEAAAEAEADSEVAAVVAGWAMADWDWEAAMVPGVAGMAMAVAMAADSTQWECRI